MHYRIKSGVKQLFSVNKFQQASCKDQMNTSHP